MTPLVAQLFDLVRQRQPRSVRGIEETRAIDPGRFDRVVDRLLGWVLGARGDDGLAAVVDAFARFSSDVIVAQARYEATGAYASRTYAEVKAAVYDQRAVMDEYLWGVLLTNVLWPHHFELHTFFERSFLAKLVGARSLLEIGSGHGGWGIEALVHYPDLRLEGFDISPSSIAIAGQLAAAAGVASRATYRQGDALALPEGPSYEVVVCCFLVEHLEDPDALFAAIAARLCGGGHAFVTGALTAAQIDHIYEFRRESELVVLAERYGMRALETLSGNPRRMLPKARFVPRSMGLVLLRE